MSDVSQLSPQQADRFFKGKPTRRELQNIFETIQSKLNQFDILLAYLAEKAEITPQVVQDWLTAKAKAKGEVKDEIPAA